MTIKLIERLEQQSVALLARHQRLQQENRLLLADKQALVADRERLKTELDEILDKLSVIERETS
ncbi:MAG: hypothetical protein P1P74_02865 [Desulfuromonadales bacterium]|nr:hypothetical protein [Desulfuromonadales bacterium]MDT8422566.1 hypothetical protein [Desulfuromonadales bacterium]